MKKNLNIKRRKWKAYTSKKEINFIKCYNFISKMWGGGEITINICVFTPSLRESITSMSRHTVLCRCCVFRKLQARDGPVWSRSVGTGFTAFAQFICLGLLLVICPIFLACSRLIFCHDDLWSWWPLKLVLQLIEDLDEGWHFLGVKLLFWLHRAACGVLVPWPGIEPVPSAVKAWGPNHWTANKPQQ